MRAALGAEPFVLFEDARTQDGAARLFTGARRIICATRLAEIADALKALRSALRMGFHCAGWISYEAGLALEERLIARAQERPTGDFPLLWFGVFEGDGRISRAELTGRLPDGSGAWLSAPAPRMSRTRYGEAFARVKDYLIAGDIYQVNLSYRADLEVLGAPLAAYVQMRAAGQGGWSAVAHDGRSWLLSTSPELFFKLADGCIEARPMKGTTQRLADPEDDARAIAALRADPKQCAENVMIVDLLRNDISKVAKSGSVRAPALLTVETYPTLHAMTSTIRAEIKENCDAIDVLRALFPCGSVTGAPKLRAMEVIAELEGDVRGAYTGAMGWLAPDGAAEFNVAIRTVVVRDGRAEVGLGSAIVVDSDCEDEWRECRAKGAFVTKQRPSFVLIETMREEPGAGVARLDLHMARLARSAGMFDYAFDAARVRSALAGRSPCDAPRLVRLCLAGDGAITLETKDLPHFGAGVVDVALAPLPVCASDFRLRHKTSLRDFYDEARMRAGAEEVVFFDDEGFLTEGSFTNVFVDQGGALLTPPASRGLLPGVLRAELLALGRAREVDLRQEDLAGGFLIGNSARGLAHARIKGGACAPP